MNSLVTEWTQDSLIALRSQPAAYRATVITDRLIAIDRQEKRTFIEKGLLIAEVETYELWRHVIDVDGEFCKSFNRWMQFWSPTGRSTGYAALGVVKELRDEIPIAELNQMPRFALETARRLSSEHRSDPEVIEALKTSSEANLDAFVEAKIPEAHLESKKPMRLYPERSQRSKIDMAISVAMELGLAGSREEALEAMAVEFLDEHRNEWEALHPKSIGVNA